jgi:Family of unknown function (DUF5681)
MSNQLESNLGGRIAAGGYACTAASGRKHMADHDEAGAPDPREDSLPGVEAPRSEGAPPGYKTGNRCPPFDRRFKKGDPSANPKGRPRKSIRSKLDGSSIAEMMKWIFEEKKKVTVDGRQMVMSNREIILRSIMSAAQKGNPGAQKLMVALLQKTDDFEQQNGEYTKWDAPQHKFSWSEQQEIMFRQLKEEFENLERDDTNAKEPDDDAADE